MSIWTWENFFILLFGLPAFLVVLAVAVHIIARTVAEAFYTEKAKFYTKWFSMVQVLAQNLLSNSGEGEGKDSNERGDGNGQSK